MRKIFSMLFLLLLLADTYAQYCPTPVICTSTQLIPSSGATRTIPALNIAAVTLVTTSGAVNMGANSFILTYDSLPKVGSNWDLRVNLSQLTCDTSKVTLFGVKPLSDYPGQKIFYIHYVVQNAGSGKQLYYNYTGAPFNGSNLVSGLTVTGTSNFYGKIKYQQPFQNAFSTDSDYTGVGSDSALKRMIAPWKIKGNSGTTPGTYFLGTTDNVGLMFKANNVQAGYIDLVNSNTLFGYGAGLSASGTLIQAYGPSAAFGATGTQITAIGNQAAESSTGSHITSLGYNAAVNAANSFITNLGESSASTGDYGVAVGYAAQAGHYGVGLGVSPPAKDNVFVLGTGVKGISLRAHATAVGWVLADSSGNGDFVPTATTSVVTTTTPVTGDSITITTNENDINPAGTLTNLTIILPANPQAGKIYYFTFLQAVTNLHWSTRLSGGANVSTLQTSTITINSVIRCKWNSTLSAWTPA